MIRIREIALLLAVLGTAIPFSVSADTTTKVAADDFERFARNDVRRSLTTRDSDSLDDANVFLRNGQIEPAVVQTTAGHGVVWSNQLSAPVRIRFEDRGIATFCREPTGFELQTEGIRRSHLLQPGEVANVCFAEAREYRYRLETANGEPLTNAAGETVTGIVRVTETR